MELLMLIGIIAVVLLAILAFKLFHSILKATISVVILLLIIGLVGGFLLVSDAKEFKDEFTSNYSTYVLQEDGTLITAFEARAFNFTSFRPVHTDELPEFTENFTGDQIYIFIDKEALVIPEDPENEMVMGVKGLLESKDEMMRSQGFMMAVTTSIMQEGPTFLFKNIQEDEISIRPQRISFALIEYTPKKVWGMAEEQYNLQKQKIKGNVSDVKNMTNISG
ncbi:MAG: hypothetical protein ACQESE_00450 [Nanobdellota archaeon]